MYITSSLIQSVWNNIKKNCIKRKNKVVNIILQKTASFFWIKHFLHTIVSIFDRTTKNHYFIFCLSFTFVVPAEREGLPCADFPMLLLLTVKSRLLTRDFSANSGREFVNENKAMGGIHALAWRFVARSTDNTSVSFPCSWSRAPTKLTTVSLISAVARASLCYYLVSSLAFQSAPVS